MNRHVEGPIAALEGAQGVASKPEVTALRCVELAQELAVDALVKAERGAGERRDLQRASPHAAYALLVDSTKTLVISVARAELVAALAAVRGGEGGG